MRIISAFHDYYDVVQSAGQDLELRYIRKNWKVDVPEWPFPIHKERWWNWRKLAPESLVVGFCGKIYPIMRIPARAASILAPYTDTLCFGADDVARWVSLNLHKKDVEAYNLPMPKRRRWHHTAAHTRQGVEKFFAQMAEEQDKHREFFEKMTAPIFLADSKRWQVRPKSGRIIECNPCLRELEFFRVLDPYTAFQELAMYLGAQAQPEKPIPTIPDKIMVGVKGFDERSFRKDPGKKRRGRK